MSAFDIIYKVLTYTAALFSILMNASPVVTIRRLEQSGTIGATTITFYGAQMYSAVCWTSYGIYVSSIPILASSTLGNAVSTYCSLVFLTVARREERSGRPLQSTTYSKSVMTSLFFAVISASHLIVSIFLIMSGKSSSAKFMTGLEGSVASVVMLSSPLMMFKRIMEVKNAEGLAPLTVTFGFFNTLLWSIAGFMTMDPFIIIPNLLCWLACVAQYMLLFLYGRHPTKTEDIKEAIAPIPFD